MNWSYIAGFFDGEGCITRNDKGVRLVITQTNFKVLEQIRKFVGFGFIIKPTKRKAHWKDSWVYYIARQKDICSFLQSVLKYLVVKRQLAEKTIPKLKIVVDNQQQRKDRRKRLVRMSRKLRSEGLTLRAIGKKLDIDFGYARRLIIKGK